MGWRNTQREYNFAACAVVYLAGLLLGGIYVGIVAPVRTAIQAAMGIDSTLGIWIVNIYTLIYATAIPIGGSVADRYGRSKVFTCCMGVFSAGALICAMSGLVGGLPLLLVGRVIQAVGAGGMMPVATAEIGALAPEGKRGMWLGIASAVAGLANVLGAAVGSGVVGLVGVNGWPWAFGMAVPVGAVLFLCALRVLPQSDLHPAGKLDLAGACVLTLFILCLLMGIKGLDFTDTIGSFLAVTTWGFLVLAVVLAIVFRGVERRAQDPVFHLEYLANSRIVMLMVLSFMVGCAIIAMTMVPEFAENALGLVSGTGGLYMAVIGIFAIVGPPVCGKLVDRFGGKPVMIGGLAVTCLGFALLAFWVAAAPTVWGLLLALAIVGLGMGFCMGTPLNYMILQNTPKEQSGAAIATISLVRQMGTTIAPAIMVGVAATAAGMVGYGRMMACVCVFCLIGMALLLLYRERRS